MIEKKLFIGGMNQDDALSVVPAEDWLDATNVRVTDDKGGGSGKVKNIEGNTLVASPIIGAYTTIGAVQDEENLNIYFFVTGDQDYILKYDGTSITIVLDGSIVTGGLNFSNRIHSVVIVNDTIYWTDNDNEPRAFHLNRDYGTTITQEDLKLIKRGPKFPLEVGKIDSATSPLLEELTNNFTKNQSFQFAYRYIYNEYQYSVLSPFSKLITHNRDDEDFDAVYISIPSIETIPNGARKIEVLVRYGDGTTFYIVDSIETGFDAHNDGTELIDTIYKNDIRGIAIPNEKAYKLFDNVPIKSQTIEAARNRLFLANNLIGYDAPSIEIAATANDTAIGSGGTEGEYIFLELIWDEEIEEGSGILFEFRERYLIVKVEGGALAGYHQIDGVTNISNAFYSQTLPPSVVISEDTLVVPIGGDIEGYYLDNFIPDGAENARTATNFTYTGLQPTAIGDTGNLAAAKATHFKSNSWYRFGIVFYDNEGRNGGVSPLTQVVRTAERAYATNEFTTSIDWEILSDDSLIPDWATHYQIVRTKNQTTSFFIQTFTYSVKYVERTDAGEYTLADNYIDGKTIGLAFDMSKLYQEGLGYTYQDGDLLFYSPSDATPNKTLQITDTWGKYVITEYESLGDLSDGGSNPKRKCLVEIYTPYTSSADEFFYEVGEAMPITDGTFSQRTGSITGDAFLVEREFDETELLSEAMNRNDKFWKLWHTDIGRTNLVIRDDGQKRLSTNIAYSNTFVQGSKINGHNSFDLLDYTDLDETNGDIKKLVLTSKVQQYGTVMLAICRHETNSIYLGETQVLDNDQNAILATSGNVIGTVNALRGSYGTVNPESVALEEGRVYWIDRLKRKVIRYDVNGLMPISDYKMASYWRNALTQPVSYDDYVGWYDDYHDEYVVRVSSTQSIAFSEKLGRWTSFYSYAPEAFCSRGITMISFKNGNLYTHDNTAYCEFYGSNNGTALTFVANETFSLQRQFKVLHIEGDTIPEQVTFTTPDPWNQITDAVTADISEKEGIYYVPIFRDMNSPNTPGDTWEKRLKGDIMQGKFLKVAATWNVPTQISIYAMGVLSKEAYGHRVTVKEEM